MSSRYLAVVFKSSSGRLQNVLPRRLQDVFKTPSSALQKVFETYTESLLNTSSRHLQDVFNMFNSRKIGLVNTSLTSFQDVLRIRISTERFTMATLHEELIMVQIF